tara:strand:+ start:3885 stop:4220 length:336 start_codon:yes stop_codon:yes gene_type:complete
MAGPLDNFANNLLIYLANVKWLEPYLGELKYSGERKLASSHLFSHATIGLLFVAVAALTHPLVAFVSILAFFLVWLAEKNEDPQRQVDWITRGCGWFVGAVFAVLILFMHL